MTTAVIGDVHGCADELERLLRLVTADRVVLVGDLYTKGPDPAGVWRLVRDRGLEAVLGNHDQRLLDALDGRRPADKGAQACIAALDAEDRAWRDHLRALPLLLDLEEDVTVVHAGVHPDQGVSGTTKGMAIAMRRWPQDDPQAPHWSLRYAGGRRVVYGHDARGGMVWISRDGHPQVVGLDTGCVYGGVLTALVLPDWSWVQVPARRVYKQVSAPEEAG